MGSDEKFDVEHPADWAPKAERDAADYAKLRAELNAALADNAALVEALNLAKDEIGIELIDLHGSGCDKVTKGRLMYACNCYVRRVLSWIEKPLAAPHPGAPLLKELADLRERLERAERACEERISEVRELQQALARHKGHKKSVRAAMEVIKSKKDGYKGSTLGLVDELHDLRAKLATVERERDEWRELADTTDQIAALKRHAEALAKALGRVSPEVADVDEPWVVSAELANEARAALAVWRASHPEGET